MMPLASDRLSRIRALQAELARLVESGAPDADDRAFDIGLEYIRLQAEHIAELTDELGELHDALRLAVIPTRWMPQA